jgi:hypothetical protein
MSRIPRHALVRAVVKVRGMELTCRGPERVAEVEDFVDFLRTREEEARDAAADRLGKAMPKFAALDLPPIE